MLERHLTHRLWDHGLTLHCEKCKFLKDSVSFFGYRFSQQGISPDPAKVRDIQDAPAPTSVSGVRSFLGMVTYCDRLMQNLSDLIWPLRDLTKSNSPWVWGEAQETTFRNTKKALSADTMLAFFDRRRDSQLSVNASPPG
ncbi:uncharacterized protein [Pleurodeles waltl]|uniref:uncharacterized protein n=1 Tax=Pleurodeles waltl TaxID=8319 RepID=UPI003709B601